MWLLFRNIISTSAAAPEKKKKSFIFIIFIVNNTICWLLNRSVWQLFFWKYLLKKYIALMC